MPNEPSLDLIPPVVDPAVVGESGEIEETTNIAEAAIKSSGPTFRMKLIAPGRGSMGYYTEEALRQAATDKIFHRGLQNFIDHPSESDTERSGTGSVSKLASVLVSDATYESEGPDGPGLYADVKAFSDYKNFLTERFNHIGVSIRASVIKTKELREGVPLVKSFAKAFSSDYVSMAGAGGKLVTLYESFKSNQPQQPAAIKEKKSMFEVNEQEFRQLQEAVKLIPGLKATIDRQNETLQRYEAQSVVASVVGESKLPERAKARIAKQFAGAMFQAPVKDGALDVTALQEAVKSAITEEETYLKESGVKVQGVVRIPSLVKESGTDKGDGDEILKEASKITDAALDRLCPKPAA